MMVEPAKKTPRITPIQIITVAAFLDSGARNAGMPFEIASTPVSAEHPDAKALRRSHRVTAVLVVAGRAAAVNVPNGWITSTTSISANITMKKYVGMEKIIPDSRSPRRLPTATSAIAPMPMATACGIVAGNADVIAATPAATDTVTVSV